MKTTFLTLAFLLSPAFVFSQQLPEWSRVYTFDDSTIEMNTSIVTFTSRDIGRVRFRWTFDKPEALRGELHKKYKSLLEVMEFNCSEQRYRPYHLTFFDAAGNTLRVEVMNPPGEWRRASGSMMEKLFAPACQLIKRKTSPPVVSSEAVELEKAAKYAISFSQHLAQAKDLKPLIKKFFADDYLKGYLQDQKTNWFLNLNRETAAEASGEELQRFYVASLNGGYLSFVYFVSQHHDAADGSIPEEKLIPADVVKLIDNHPYTARYQEQNNYDFLAENVDSVERLRSYTDLLEGINALMRRHVTRAGAEQSSEYQVELEDLDLYRPKIRVCAANCLGLSKGTRVIEVNVPGLKLQLAEIKGKLKVVSVKDYFH